MTRRPSLLLLLPVALAALAACKKDPPPPTATTSASVAAPAVPAVPPSPPLPLDRLSETREGSSLVLARLGAKKVAIVADEDTSTIRIVDLADKKEVGTLSIPGRPGQMLVTKEGKLLVALRDDGAVLIAEAHANGSLKSLDRIPTSTEPFALALSPDDRSLYVACAWSHTLEGYELGTKAKTLSMDVAREPRAVLVSQDGTHAFVAHGADGVTETIDLAGKSKKVADLGIAAITIPIAPPRPARAFDSRGRVIFDALVPVSASLSGVDELDDCLDCGFSFVNDLGNPKRFARQGYALARFEAHDAKGKSLGERILEPHAEVIPGDPREGTIVYYGGSDFDAPPTNQFGFSILDASTGKRAKLVAGPAWTNKQACHLPRAAAVDAKQSVVYTACLGSDAIHAYSLTGGVVSAIPTYRVDVPTPTGVAIDPETSRVYVLSAFDRTLSSFAPPEAPKAGKTVKAPIREDMTLEGKTSLTEQQILGRKLFHSAGDPRIAVDGRSCSSCHMDGREDGLVWSTPTGPRQTIQLAGRLSRPAPFGWVGKDGSIQEHMKQTISNFAGSGLKPEELDALAAYMTVMKGPPQKWRALTSEESRGKDVFASSDTGCSGCHAEKSGFSDHDVHDVKSATFSDSTQRFLVPSLTGIAGSAPYFHDGSYATLEELLDKTDGKMGTTKNLSPEDKKALVAYLKTL